jgi:hypothetical protein
MKATIETLRIEAQEAKADSLYAFENSSAHSAEYKAARRRYEKIAKRLADLIHMRDARKSTEAVYTIDAEQVAQRFLFAALRKADIGVNRAQAVVHVSGIAISDITNGRIQPPEGAALINADKAARTYFIERIKEGHDGATSVAETICAVPSFAKALGVRVYDMPIGSAPAQIVAN